LITTDEDTKAIHEISLLSGVDENVVQKIFDAFFIKFTFGYGNNKPIHVPYVGNFFVRFKKDETTLEGKEALVDAFYSPHDEVKRIAGQLKDISSTNEFTTFDGYIMLKKLIKNDFKLALGKETFCD